MSARHRLISAAMTVALVVIIGCSRSGSIEPNTGESTGSPIDKAPDQSRPLTVKVAAIQCSSTLGDVEGNRNKLTALVREAAGQGARIIVLPEAAITGYLSQDLHTNWHVKNWPMEAVFEGKDPLPYAEAVPGASTAYFSRLGEGTPGLPDHSSGGGRARAG